MDKEITLGKNEKDISYPFWTQFHIVKSDFQKFQVSILMSHFNCERFHTLIMGKIITSEKTQTCFFYPFWTQFDIVQ